MYFGFTVSPGRTSPSRSMENVPAEPPRALVAFRRTAAAVSTDDSRRFAIADVLVNDAAATAAPIAAMASTTISSRSEKPDSRRCNLIMGYSTIWERRTSAP